MRRLTASNTGARTYVAEAKTEQKTLQTEHYEYSSGGSRAINTKGHIYAL